MDTADEDKGADRPDRILGPVPRRAFVELPILYKPIKAPTV